MYRLELNDAAETIHDEDDFDYRRYHVASRGLTMQIGVK